MKNILLILLVLIAIVMIFLGIKGGILPPALTGIGFIVIAVLFHRNNTSI
jgi:small-conductance mechanosensitive channel